MKEIKQAKLNHVRSVNFTQSENNSVNSGARTLNKTHYMKTVKSSAKKTRDHTSPPDYMDHFQKERLQNSSIVFIFMLTLTRRKHCWPCEENTFLTVILSYRLPLIYRFHLRFQSEGAV